MTRRLLFVLCILAAALVALPAGASAKAKRPTVTLVSPMRIAVGTTITIRGRNFNKVARRNTVLFSGPNGRTVFVKPIRATSKRLVVRVPSSLAKLFATRSGDPISTRLKLQVFANKQRSRALGRTSPLIVPTGADKPAPGAPAPEKITTGGGGAVTPAGPPPPCGSGSDWDGDLLSNTLEGTLGTDICKKDTDGDGVEDGFEYKSAVDLNDDEFQEPNTSLPYPGSRPYPNPLDGSDAGKDFDGDSLTSTEEQALWNLTITNGDTRTLDPLTYSAGEQYSVNVRGADGHRTPTLSATGYSKQQDFLAWASAEGYRNPRLVNGPPFGLWYDQSGQSAYGLLDMNRAGGEQAGFPGASYWFRETRYYDIFQDLLLSDNERDEDADGLTNFDETHGRTSRQSWWTSCYQDAAEGAFPIDYAGTDYLKSDTDGDGIRDGADDIDHDDIPNVMELSRNAASGFDDTKGGQNWCHLTDVLPNISARPAAYGRVNPFNPCLPNPNSRTCPLYIEFETAPPAPFDDSENWYSLN